MPTTSQEIRLSAYQMNVLAEKVAKKIYDMMPKPPEEFLTTAEAAEYLNMSASAIYHATDIPYTKRGKKKLYTKAALAAYMNREI